MHLTLPLQDGISNEQRETFSMTEELKKCPYLQEVLSTFKCDKLTFRVQNLKAGGKIGIHNDGNRGLNNNIVRLNIPVSTNEDVYTYYNEERILMKNGECWLPNVIKPHEMKNNSDQTRWLILIDCDLNDWWKDVLREKGVDFDNISKHASSSLKELQSMKEAFISMNMDKKMIEELEVEIAARVGM
jgi:hypothetical protein